jgi:PAS domain S-box-containing protein
MFRNIKISTKITAIVLILTIISIVTISLFTYKINEETKLEELGRSVSSFALTNKAIVDNYLSSINNSFALLQQTSSFSNLDSLNPDDLKESFHWDDIIVTDQKGQIVKSTNENFSVGNNFSDVGVSFFEHASKALYFSNTKKTEDGKYFVYAGTLVGENLWIAKISLTELFDSLEKGEKLGASGETIIARQDRDTKKVIIQNPVRLDKVNGLKPFDLDDSRSEIVKAASKNEIGVGKAIDYRNKEVLAAWAKSKFADWVVIAKYDFNETIDARQAKLKETYTFAGLSIVLLAILFSMVFARSLSQPLNTMRNTLEMVAKGVLPEKEEQHSSDEFGLMGEKVDELVQVLKNNADFAQKVGEGKFDAEFKPASENDTLGLSLINMRNNLIENERRDTERNWIVRGVAEVGEILRLHDTIEGLGDDVIKFILEKIGAIQGAFYVVNDEDGEKKIEMRASFAYSRKKYLKKSFRFAEGLVGQAAIEQDTVMRTEIPDEYLSITSGILGEQKPRCILIVPLITNEEVYGVLEFAGFKRFDPSQVKFVQELSLILARTIFNIKVNERTRKHLAESQAMSSELKEKQEVLRQNAEEMQATQEELQRSNQRLEEQVEEVNNTQKRMQLLLENASEVITIYEQDGTIRYISPSVKPILGYSPSELQGKRDMDKVHPDYQEAFANMFANLKASPDERTSVQYEYKTKGGSYVWIESTGTNNMANPAIRGYIINSRDITERRRAEQEQRMRSKMQALSENSLDLITRLENDSISYINPVIESFTGKEPEHFLNKKIKETELDPSILDKWLQIVEQVNTSNDKVSTEMDFPTSQGKLIMQVNAIPEYDENKILESVLVVSHDITERKLIEVEIQNKNKKINDSINYAKRIQNAILPNTRLINKTLPDSFILYKPRDVVSGDFPWFVQTKTDIYIAAVDCTGHGVPGALLSLIGYFLLNDIVRSRKITDPGKILDLLDEGVTQTLRQDQDDSATKDGMDIALCRINTETREVEYAGAHRPLYYMKGGVMDEIKGNKFPIGGGIFKNQTNFTNTKLQLSAGDSIYFSSDGFPDQFGGPEGRKFGPKKVREIIEKAHTLPMKDAALIFDQEWEGWKSDHKQTDDVLLIGIKF